MADCDSCTQHGELVCVMYSHPDIHMPMYIYAFSEKGVNPNKLRLSMWPVCRSEGGEVRVRGLHCHGRETAEEDLSGDEGEMADLQGCYCPQNRVCCHDDWCIHLLLASQSRGKLNMLLRLTAATVTTFLFRADF